MPEINRDGHILVVSDIHAAPQPLRDVLERESIVCTRICLGDVVGYGRESEEAVRLVRDFDLCIMGNHDRLALGLADPTRFSKHARATSPSLSPESLDVLRTLVPSFRIGDVHLFHGSPKSDEEYLFNEVDVRRVLMDYPDVRLMFGGHLHIPRLARFCDETAVLDFEDLDPAGSENALQLDRFRYLVNAPSLSTGRLGYGGGYCLLGPASDGNRRLCFLRTDRSDYSMDHLRLL
jgi:predicted phosphodiesterase